MKITGTQLKKAAVIKERAIPRLALLPMLLIVALLVSLFSSQSVWAQAYCALRDPNNAVYEMYPKATSYKSIVRVVDESTRRQVEERLPPQSLHFSELGRHTLYVPLQDKNPLGYVHVRSEQSPWGLVEIAWALDKQLRIIDFKFQRCRTGKKKLLETEVFRNQLIGKNFDELMDFLKPGTADIDAEKLSIPAGAEELAQVLIRCGLKTALVTEIAWKKDISDQSFSQKAYEFYPAMATIKIIDDPLTQNVLDELHKVLENSSLESAEEKVSIGQVYSIKGKLLGSIYRRDVTIDNNIETLWWGIDANQTLRGVVNANGWQSDYDADIFNALKGKKYVELATCSNRAELLALEATVTTSLLAQGI